MAPMGDESTIAERRQRAAKMDLHQAAGAGRVADVKFVLMYQEGRANEWNQFTSTPLHKTAAYDRVEVAVLLLQNGADPGAAKEDGVTPLHYAAEHNSIEVAKVLLEARADPNAMSDAKLLGKTKWGTPLSRAEHRSHTELAELLKRFGARELVPSK
eukprot:TRINITY_DN50106_c0_g1_i1.p1 TRINITY_DN50106_c0_g1~~TRINITY_DN50106_c0_g1_i1.p1  ORF type:complete len:157 (+),score=42.32 TRINITY_DN50106_c0_g1_i1:222-692(+)